ncbi:hypothetical protein ABKN59_005969 [Abortiporus biennis]
MTSLPSDDRFLLSTTSLDTCAFAGDITFFMPGFDDTHIQDMYAFGPLRCHVSRPHFNHVFFLSHAPVISSLHCFYLWLVYGFE